MRTFTPLKRGRPSYGSLLHPLPLHPYLHAEIHGSEPSPIQILTSLLARTSHPFSRPLVPAPE